MSADRAEPSLSGEGLASALNILEGRVREIVRLAYNQAGEGNLKEAFETLTYAYEQVPVLFEPHNHRGISLLVPEYEVMDGKTMGNFLVNAQQLSSVLQHMVMELKQPGRAIFPEVESPESTDSEDEGPDPIIPLAVPRPEDVAMTSVELSATIPARPKGLAPYLTPRRHILPGESTFISRVTMVELVDVTLWESQFQKLIEDLPSPEINARTKNRIHFMRILGNVHTKHVIRSLRDRRIRLPNGARADTTMKHIADRIEMYRRARYQRDREEDPNYNPPNPPARPRPSITLQVEAGQEMIVYPPTNA